MKVNWHQISDRLGMNRNKLYHWYYETHLRHLHDDKITPQEKQAMLQLIMNAIETRAIENPSFQSVLKTQVFGDR